MNIKTTLKSSVAAAALFAIAAPVAPSVNAADDTLSSGNKNSLKISGYVSKALSYADDGFSDALFITDGSTSRSRIRWVAKGTLNENVTAGAMIEMDIPLSNQRNAVTLGTLGTDGVESNETQLWTIRHQFVWVNHKKMGKISLGNTNAASNGRSETTFSATNMVDLSSAKPFGGGINFIDTTNGRALASVSTVTVGAAFTNFDGRSRTDVLRYDTPRFAGLSLATSFIAGGDWDIAGDYRAKFGGVRIRVQAQFNSLSATSATAQSEASVSAAALHDSGVNAAFAYGQRNLDGTANIGRQGDPKFWYFNVGYRAKVFGVGGTNFSFSWNRSTDLVAGNSDADSVGFSIAQIFNPISANMVFSYRNFSYDTATNTFDDVDVISLQTIFHF
ncbi:MAG: hypothetical protein IH994_07665 [Proteobacteria bacterium]|nr:hypothetical protein [Pseudomonadota bacterium]